MAKLDLTGRRFGRLTVRGENPDPYVSPAGKKTRRWDCLCDCGNTVTLLQNALCSMSNPTTSCGCARRDAQQEHRKDITGQRFGRLTIIGPALLDKPEANGVTHGWLAKCDCGKMVVVSRKSLLSGVQSCGCLLSDTARLKIDNNVMQRVDGTQLTAIRPGRKANSNSKSGYKGVYWSDREGRYIAKIGVKGKTITIGRFRLLGDAVKARAAAEEEYYKPILDAHKEDETDPL